MSLLPLKKTRRDMTTALNAQIVRLGREGGDRWFNDDASYVKWIEDRKKRACKEKEKKATEAREEVLQDEIAELRAVIVAKDKEI